MSLRTHPLGFALIEVLIALLLTVACLLVVVPLFALLAHNNALVWQRAIAAQLAQEKLEDLQGFSQLEGDAAGPSVFDAIQDDQGGMGPASGAVERGPYVYQLSWRVESHDTCSPEAPPAPRACPEHWHAAFKTVSMRVDWIDDWSDAQRLDLQTDIAAVHPDLAMTALLRSPQLPPPTR